MARQWPVPGRRGTLLVLLGAGLAAVTLTVGVGTQGAMPVAAGAPEPATPPSITPTSDTPPVEPTSAVPTPPDSSAGATPTTSSRPAPSTTSPPTSPSTSRPTPKRPPAPAGEPTFRAVAGPACPTTSSRSVRVSPGCQVVPGDSWTGDGCGDRFLYSAPDDPNYVQWRFTFDAPADRSCRIAVFVPDSPLAGASVWYGVADRFENAGYRVGGFTVDQDAGRGRWTDGGTVSVSTGTLLVNVNGDQEPTGVTAGPLRVSCWPTER
jgi:hypothetical protein